MGGVQLTLVTLGELSLLLSFVRIDSRDLIIKMKT